MKAISSNQRFSMDRRRFLKICGKTMALTTGCVLIPEKKFTTWADAALLEKGRKGQKLSPYFTSIGNNLIRCDLCPHACEVEEGERGLCGVRQNIAGKYYSLVYGNPCSVHVDPIEKKPFFHVLPGTASYSLATAGCNFDCKFCQNWEISQAKPEETMNFSLSPEQAGADAVRYGCRSIASTYVEPTIFMEYMLDLGREAKKRALLKVMHSNGFMHPKPLSDLCEVLDAACIDLKGFTEDYYRDMTGGQLQPVLKTLKILANRKIHTEIVVLLVTGRNDDPALIKRMSEWIFNELGPDVPVHFSRFYPRYKLKSLPPTPVSALETARDVAMAIGLRFVYVGNVYLHPGESTYCPECRKIVIERNGYRVNLAGFKGGACRACGHKIPGIWEKLDLAGGG